jgi:hypothetical protein
LDKTTFLLVAILGPLVRFVPPNPNPKIHKYIHSFSGDSVLSPEVREK